jgi:hypothetical protein
MVQSFADPELLEYLIKNISRFEFQPFARKYTVGGSSVGGRTQEDRRGIRGEEHNQQKMTVHA